MQLIKYKWDVNKISGEPFLFARDGDKITRMRLFDEQINIRLGKRHCIGYTKNGRHFDCPRDREVDSEKMCRECAINDDYFLCMKCTGEECINEPQRPACMENKYYIYLAAFGSMLKVGISYEHRLLERLIEQGADMGAKIGVVQDGKLVRSIEQKIRRELNITDRMTGLEKHNMLFGSINVASINIFNAFNRLRSNGVSKYLTGPEIYNLQDVYRLSNIGEMPRIVHTEPGQEMSGEIVAAKGNIIIFKNSTGLLSVNAHRLVGHDVEMLG